MSERMGRMTCLALGGLVMASAGAAHAQSSRAFYRVEFRTHWTQAVHGSAYISTAHFSPLVGMIHNADASMWEPGELASFAIERMAETGSSAELQAVANDFIAAGSARRRVVGPGMDEVDLVEYPSLELTSIHPLFTMVTMVAPSPDWFVGTHGVSLMDQNGEWIPELVIPLDVYDSGTDSGTAFSSPNADTQPPEPIRNIQNEPPFSGVPAIATMTFTLQSVDECIADLNRDGQLSPADFNAWVLAFNQQDPAADQNDDGLVSPSDFNAWIINYNGGC